MTETIGMTTEVALVPEVLEPVPTNVLVVAGIRNKRSLGWEAASKWLELDPDHEVVATVRSDKSLVDVEKEASKIDGKVSLVQVDWVDPESPAVLKEALEALLGEERRVSGVVHSVASADNSNFVLPAHEIDGDIYRDAANATTFSLVRLVQGAREHMRDGAGIVTYGFGQPGRSMEGYGGALTVAKAALSQLVVDLGTSLGQAEPRARTAEIVPGYIPTVSAKGAVQIGSIDSANVERNFQENAALTNTSGKSQKEALGHLTVAFIASPAFAQTTSVRLPVDGGWFNRSGLT